MFGFLYSVFAYVAFLASFGYLAFFANDLLVPFTVDSGQPGGAFSSVLVDVGLILLFGVQHSVMARDSFKRRITRVLPAHLERSTYVLASALALVVLYAGWQPVPGLVWHVETPALRVALYGLNALGWVGVPVASFLIDHFDLFGLKQAFAAWRKRPVEVAQIRVAPIRLGMAEKKKPRHGRPPESSRCRRHRRLHRRGTPADPRWAAAPAPRPGRRPGHDLA